MEKKFQLIEKRVDNIASKRFSFTPTNGIWIKHRPPINTVSALILSVKKQIKSHEECEGAHVGSAQAIKPTTTEYGRNRTKWNLICLVIFPVILLWLNDLYCDQSPTYYNAKVINSNECRLSLFSV